MKTVKYSIVFLLLLLTMGGGSTAFGQDSKASFQKKMKKLEKEADYYFERDYYLIAQPLYDTILKYQTNNADVQLKAGLCRFYTENDKSLSTPFFKEAIKAGNKTASFYLGRCMYLSGSVDSAMYYYNLFDNKSITADAPDRPLVDQSLSQVRVASELMKNPVKALITNLGSPVNSLYDDYTPMVHADDQKLYFTSRRPDSIGDSIDYVGNHYEDIYVSEKNGDRWGPPTNPGPPINTPLHDAVVGTTPDGNHLIIYRTSKNIYEGDLLTADVRDSGFGEIKPLPSPINSSFQEASACYSQDAQTIFFSGIRPEGYGGLDIYRVVKFGNGEWSKPLNLGPLVNTPFDEDAPFLHPDNQTLFFCSKGHQGMGGYDIFESTLDSAGAWSPAKNMGYPINTVNNDIFFMLTGDGINGYLSSTRQKGNGLDIFHVNLEGHERHLYILKGIMKDMGGNLISGEIIVKDANGEIFGKYKTNHQTGKFLIILPEKKNFVAEMHASGYKAKIENWYMDMPYFEQETIIIMEAEK